MNFDANWYAYLYDRELYRAYLQDRERTRESRIEDYYEGTDIEEMERLARLMPLSGKSRPQWDLEVLSRIGFSECTADAGIGDRVLSEAEKINYRSTPMFLIRAQK